MYGMFRSWLSTAATATEEPVYSRFDSLTPPDTLVRVGSDGEYHFVAHRGVLAAHSGYLKALLAATGTPTEDSVPPDGPIVSSIAVPTIGGEAFAPLLSYMYTGRLDVSLDNIYSVLVATHLLHMPGALEQCRAALIRLQAVPPPPSTTVTNASDTNILRPIPSRNLLAPQFCWQGPRLFGAPSTHHPPSLPFGPVVDFSTHPSFPSFFSVSNFLRKSATSPSLNTSGHGSKDRSSSSSSPARNATRSPSLSPELIVASSNSNSSSSSICSQSRPTSPTTPKKILATATAVSKTDHQRKSSGKLHNSNRHRHHHRHNRDSGVPLRANSPSAAVGTSGTVFDVACCDGPVRFHRVLNENYSGNKLSASATSGSSVPPGPAPRTESTRCVESSPSRDDETENDENQEKLGSFKCGYCKITFKSQYCYKKHARRHILPPNNETPSHEPEPQQQIQQRQQQQVEETAKKPSGRQVRLLDLNVQYYPCKICGSKFPSYYFVHKHRKLCHPNLDESGQPLVNFEEKVANHQEQPGADYHQLGQT